MFKRMKNTKLIFFLACLTGMAGCGYFGTWDTKYYKYQPTFQDRALARSIVTDKEALINKSLEDIMPFLDESKKDDIKKALRDMVDNANKGVKTEEEIKKKHKEVVETCSKKIKDYIKSDNPGLEDKKQKIENVLAVLAEKWVGYEEKEYTVNGLKFKVKDNCINFTDLEVSVPLDDIRISDADVLGFTSDIQKALRWRMDTARRVRLGSGTAQILAAAAGATLGLATGDVMTAAALAAFSAVIPELQNIFQARDRSGAYEQGLELIQDAESRYYLSRTATETIGTVSATELTKEGGELLAQISACIKLVDKALFQTIPTLADLQAATGRLTDALGQIKVVPNGLMSIGVNGTQTVRVINSSAIAYSVGDVAVVTVDNADAFARGTDTIVIRGVGIGTSTVTVFNALGNAGHFDVSVGNVNYAETGSATNVGANTATLKGVVKPPTGAWFEYGTNAAALDTPTQHKSGGPVEETISNLTPGVEYYYRMVGSSTTGLFYGETKNILTPIAITDAISDKDIGVGTATLHGKVLAVDAKTKAYFVYSPDEECSKVKGTQTEASPKIGENDLNRPIDVSLVALDLLPATTYYFKIITEKVIAEKNPVKIMEGTVETFTTKSK